MSSTIEQVQSVAGSGLPGAAMLRRLRVLIVEAVIAAFAYAGLTAASKSVCFGGSDANGGFLDADGHPSQTVPICVTATLHASPFILIAIAAIVFFTIGRVLARARDEASAIRTFHRAAIIVLAVAAVSVAAAYVCFFAFTPLEGLPDEGFHYLGFPFAVVDVTTTSLAN